MILVHIMQSASKKTKSVWLQNSLPPFLSSPPLFFLLHSFLFSIHPSLPLFSLPLSCFLPPLLSLFHIFSFLSTYYAGLPSPLVPKLDFPILMKRADTVYGFSEWSICKRIHSYTEPEILVTIFIVLQYEKLGLLMHYYILIDSGARLKIFGFLRFDQSNKGM